jgi:hypothetical protein
MSRRKRPNLFNRPRGGAQAGAARQNRVQVGAAGPGLVAIRFDWATSLATMSPADARDIARLLHAAAEDAERTANPPEPTIPRPFLQAALDAVREQVKAQVRQAVAERSRSLREDLARALAAGGSDGGATWDEDDGNPGADPAAAAERQDRARMTAEGGPDPHDEEAA